MNKLLLYFIGLMFSSTTFCDEGVVGSTSQPLTLGNRIYITNTTSKRLDFNVRPKNGRWSPYYLDSGEGMEIKCNNCITDSFEFKMKTDTRVVNYTLPDASKYKLAWNEKKKLWDLLFQ